MNDNNALILEMLKRMDRSLVTLTKDFHERVESSEARMITLELYMRQVQRKKRLRNGLIASGLLAMGSYLLPYAKQASVDFIKEPRAVINGAEVDNNEAA